MSNIRKFSSVILVGITTWIIPLLAFAEEGGASEGAGALVAIGSGLAVGIAALGGGLGQGRAVASALEGIARNPGAKDKIQTPMILGLAMIESLVILSFVIAIILTGKI